MNTSSRLRYFLGLVLLVLLGLAIGVQNGADVIEHPATGTAAPAETSAQLVARH